MSAHRYSSDQIRLGRVAGALAGTILLAGCDDEVTRSYPDVQACINDQVFTPVFCEKSFNEAKETHADVAPLYEDPADCKKDWDSCDQAAPTTQHHSVVTSGGGGSHVVIMSTNPSSPYYQPRMAGFLAGREANTAKEGAPPPKTYTESVSKTADGDFRTMQTRTAFENFGRVSGRSSVSTGEAIASRPVMGRGTAISRGGFVSGARGFSIGG